jgi:hypothetical protein
MYYGNSTALRLWKNKANQSQFPQNPTAANPGAPPERDYAKRSQFPGGQINVTVFRKKDYEKNLVGGFQKTDPISKQPQSPDLPGALANLPDEPDLSCLEFDSLMCARSTGLDITAGAGQW